MPSPRVSIAFAAWSSTLLPASMTTDIIGKNEIDARVALEEQRREVDEDLMELSDCKAEFGNNICDVKCK